jgi:hemerythrin-like domain-containing protein
MTTAAPLTTAPPEQPAPAGIALTLQHYLKEQARFCDRLETMADRLPDGVDARDCLLMAQNVVPLVKRAHEFEEGIVYPLLLSLPGTSAELRSSIERLRFEHLGDEEFAGDLCSSLRQFVTDRATSNVESLAWMLRGFFESVRRHIAFEREHILPLVQRHSS